MVIVYNNIFLFLITSDYIKLEHLYQLVKLNTLRKVLKLKYNFH